MQRVKRRRRATFELIAFAGACALAIGALGGIAYLTGRAIVEALGR